MLNQSNSSFDQEISKKFNACIDNGFPICLDLALQEMFGKSGTDLLKALARKTTLVSNVQMLSSARDTWELYVEHVAAWNKALGEDSTKVLEFKSLEKMTRLGCQNCPMYELEILRVE